MHPAAASDRLSGRNVATVYTVYSTCIYSNQSVFAAFELLLPSTAYLCIFLAYLRDLQSEVKLQLDNGGRNVSSSVCKRQRSCGPGLQINELLNHTQVKVTIADMLTEIHKFTNTHTTLRNTFYGNVLTVTV